MTDEMSEYVQTVLKCCESANCADNGESAVQNQGMP